MYAVKFSPTSRQRELMTPEQVEEYKARPLFLCCVKAEDPVTGRMEIVTDEWSQQEADRFPDKERAKQAVKATGFPLAQCLLTPDPFPPAERPVRTFATYSTKP